MEAGERIVVDYFYVPPGQVAACLTSPKAEKYLHDQHDRHTDIYGDKEQCVYCDLRCLKCIAVIYAARRRRLQASS